MQQVGISALEFDLLCPEFVNYQCRTVTDCFVHRIVEQLSTGRKSLKIFDSAFAQANDQPDKVSEVDAQVRAVLNLPCCDIIDELHGLLPRSCAAETYYQMFLGSRLLSSSTLCTSFG